MEGGATIPAPLKHLWVFNASRLTHALEHREGTRWVPEVKSECMWHIPACRQGKASSFPLPCPLHGPPAFQHPALEKGYLSLWWDMGAGTAPSVCPRAAQVWTEQCWGRGGFATIKQRTEHFWTLQEPPREQGCRQWGTHGAVSIQLCKMHSGAQPSPHISCTHLPHSALLAQPTSVLSSRVTNGHPAAQAYLGDAL